MMNTDETSHLKGRVAIESILIRQRHRICYIQTQIHYTVVTLSVGQGLHQDQKVGMVGTVVVARRDLHLLNEEVKRVKEDESGEDLG